MGRLSGTAYFLPFSPFDCLSQSGLDSAHFETPPTPYFSDAYDSCFCLPGSTSTFERFTSFFYPPQGATREPKCDPFRCTKSFSFSIVRSVGGRRQVSLFPALPIAVSAVASRYSNRRISTGNRREAALAGSNVAPMEMAIATTVIHNSIPNARVKRNKRHGINLRVERNQVKLPATHENA